MLHNLSLSTLEAIAILSCLTLFKNQKLMCGARKEKLHNWEIM